MLGAGFAKAAWYTTKGPTVCENPWILVGQSDTDYGHDLDNYYRDHVADDFNLFRQKLIYLLAEETKLLEIVKLIGSDVLPDDQKLIIELGRVIRIGFLQQNAFHNDDTYVPLKKQYDMMRIIIFLYDQGLQYVSERKSIQVLKETQIFENIIQMKYDISNDDSSSFDTYSSMIKDVMRRID